MSKSSLEFFQWFIKIVTAVFMISVITKASAGDILTKVDLSHSIIVFLMNIGLYFTSKKVKETEK